MTANITSLYKIAAITWLGLVSTAQAEFTNIFKINETILPGSETPFSGASFIPSHTEGEYLVKATSGQNQYLYAYQNGEYELLINGTNGYPGGLTIRFLEIAVADESTFIAVSHVDTATASPHNSVIFEYKNGTVSQTSIPDAVTELGNTSSGNGYTLTGATPDGSVLSAIGKDFVFNHFILRIENNEVEILAQESQTDVPDTDATFNTLSDLRMSSDGSRFIFAGQLNDNQRGLYLWENNELQTVISTYENFPETDIKITSFTAGKGFEADGSYYFTAFNAFSISKPTDRIMLFRLTSDNELEVVADNTTEIEGAQLGYIENYQTTSDGTLIIKAGTRLIAYDGNTLEEIVNTSGFTSTFLVKGDSIYLTSFKNIGGGEFLKELHSAPATGGIPQRLHTVNEVPPSSFDNVTALEFSGDNPANVLMLIGTSYHIGTVNDFSLSPPPNPARPYFMALSYNGDFIESNFNYGWFYAPEAHWPWVYSFTLEMWLYVNPDRPIGSPLYAYNPDLGWFMTRNTIWGIAYYSFDQEDWFAF